MTSNGYIKLHRCIFNNWTWNDKPFSYGQAWVDLLLLAQYDDGMMLYRDDLMETKRGSVYRSIQWLANRWGWGRKKTRHFLGLLERDNMVTIESTTRGTTLTIVKYDDFQVLGTTKGTTDGITEAQQTAQQRNNRGNTYNKDNKENKENKERVRTFKPPTLDEVKAYFAEKGINDPKEPQAFMDYYTSNGWKVGRNSMKDWKATIRTWINRGYNKPTKEKQRYDTSDRHVESI